MGASTMLQTRQEPIADDRKILVIEDSRTFSLALRQFLEAETAKWRDLVKRANIKPAEK